MTATPSTAPQPDDVQHSPLEAEHEAAGATFTDFGGWKMPLRYTSDLAEHRAVREKVGIFDISHMAEISVTGVDAARYLDYALAGAISKVKLTRAKYSLILDDNGGIIDDIIVYHTMPGEYLVVANAANHDAALAALTSRASGFDVELTDQTRDIALIAVQGPHALDVLAAVDELVPFTPRSAEFAGTAQSFAELPYYASIAARFGSTALRVGRTGYTGEDGFEIFVPAASAVELWRQLVAVGEPLGLALCGLACRDTLRLEAGMPLYGHELSRDTLPAQAGLGRVVALDKPDFVGKQAIEAATAASEHPLDTRPVLVGLIGEGRRAARAGYQVLAQATDPAEVIGTVTSGVLSPTLGYPIAMAYVTPEFATPGTVADVDVRGSRLPMTVSALPFYKRQK